MAESSDIFHDYRVQKEAYSLATNGYPVTVFNFRPHKARDTLNFLFIDCVISLFIRILFAIIPPVTIHYDYFLIL